MNRAPLPALSGPPGDRLEIVSAWDDTTPYQSWRPQILVPATHRPAAPTRVYAVVNQKGGAGKTTTSVELGAAWAAAGLRVRLIDGDTQEAALSAWLPPCCTTPAAPNACGTGCGSSPAAPPTGRGTPVRTPGTTDRAALRAPGRPGTT